MNFLIKKPPSSNQSGGVEKKEINQKRILTKNIKNLSVQLSTRLSGFVDKEQQKYLLDTKSPKSATSGIFIPPENYDIVFNVSSPVKSLTYSGVLLEKTEGGWIANGYDDV